MQERWQRYQVCIWLLEFSSIWRMKCGMYIEKGGSRMSFIYASPRKRYELLNEKKPSLNHLNLETLIQRACPGQPILAASRCAYKGNMSVSLCFPKLTIRLARFVPVIFHVLLVLRSTSGVAAEGFGVRHNMLTTAGAKVKLGSPDYQEQL